MILTNSNHPLVLEQYCKFPIQVVQTKRYISSNGKGRTGEDVIVTIPPKPRFNWRVVPSPLPLQAMQYPTTRFMGSKNKLLTEIWAVASQFDFESVLDLFSGSGIVGYMFKSHGKTVISNDYMAMSAIFAKAMIENNEITLSKDEALALLESRQPVDYFVETKFQGLYFSDTDNRIVVEVTLTDNSRQEAAEGEPVRRHVADIISNYEVTRYDAQFIKPVYGLFIANRIDSNTAETFRIGVWFTRTDDKMRLDIIPLTLKQFKAFFEALFKSGRVEVGLVRSLLDLCSQVRPVHEAPAWKQQIGNIVQQQINALST